MTKLKFRWPVQWMAVIALGVIGVAVMHAPLFGAATPGCHLAAVDR